MRIWVAGDGGFIGSALCRYLSEAGHEVTGYSRSRDGDLTASSIPDDMDVLVNSIGRLGSPTVTPDELTQSNALVPSMLGTVAATRGIHLIHISTPGVTGLMKASDENSPYAPWGDYERSKTVGENALRKHESLNRELLTILRPDFVYGPGDLHKLDLFRQVSRGWMPLIGLSGAVLRPTYVTDVCRSVEASLPGGCLNGGIFNIGGPGTISMRGFSRLIARAIGRRLFLAPFPRIAYRIAMKIGPLRRAGLSESRIRLFGEDHHVSIKRASAAGFNPEWDAESGVSSTVSWYLAQGLVD